MMNHPNSTTSPPVPAPSTSPGWRRRESLAGYLFLLPSLIPFAIFVAVPLVAAIALTFTKYDILTPPKFNGLANYRQFISDPRLPRIYANTALYVLGTVSLETVLALILAVATNRKISAALRYFLRTAYFFPVLTSLASVSIVWGYLYHTNFGVINYYIRQLGGSTIPWLTSSSWALPALIFLGVWKSIGFSYILFIAGLQSIPRHLYEAASIDGAGALSSFRNITLPLLSPTMFFAIVISLINSFQVFDSPFIITQGGPGDATRTISLYIYEQGFRFFSMGYASTVALSLFLVILLLTLVQFRLGRSWVFYQ